MPLDEPSEVVTARHLEAANTIEAGDGLDLVVWPENVIATVDFTTSTERAEVAAEAQRLDAVRRRRDRGRRRTAGQAL